MTSLLYAGNLKIAYRRINEDFGELQLGDSTSTAGMTVATTWGWGMMQAFRPRKWGGFGATGCGTTAFGVTWRVNPTWATRSWATALSGPNSLTGWQGFVESRAGGTSGEYHTYNGGTVAADANVYWTRLLDATFDINYFPNTTMFDGLGATWDYLTVQHSRGTPTFMIRARNNLTKLTEKTDCTAYAATPTFQKYSLTIGAQTWSAGTLSFNVMSTPNQVTVDGDSICHLGYNIKLQDGFRPMNIGMGGLRAEDYIPTSYFSDAAWTALMDMHNTHAVRICLGINWYTNKTEYKGFITSTMDKLKEIRPNLQFILVPPHQAANTVVQYQDITDALYEIALARTDALFLNVYRLCYGDGATPTAIYTNVNARLLSDGVHPSQTGYSYKANAEWLLTELAAAECKAVRYSTSSGTAFRAYPRR